MRSQNQFRGGEKRKEKLSQNDKLYNALEREKKREAARKKETTDASPAKS